MPGTLSRKVRENERMRENESVCVCVRERERKRVRKIARLVGRCGVARESFSFSSFLFCLDLRTDRGTNKQRT